MNNAFLLVRTLQVGGLFFGVPKIYDRDCRSSFWYFSLELPVEEPPSYYSL